MFRRGAVVRSRRSVAAEDTLGLTGSTNGGTITVAVPRLPRIANFDDLDPLAAEPDVRLDIVEPGQAISADADMVVLPGSKSTATDLAFLRDQGWDIDILAHRRRGGRVLGLCGGYQMLGRTISDPAGSEGKAGTFAGLGLLDVKTVLSPDKTTQAVDAVSLPERHPISAYEIHLGTTEGPIAQGRSVRWVGRTRARVRTMAWWPEPICTDYFPLTGFGTDFSKHWDRWVRRCGMRPRSKPRSTRWLLIWK